MQYNSSRENSSPCNNNSRIRQEKTRTSSDSENSEFWEILLYIKIKINTVLYSTVSLSSNQKSWGKSRNIQIISNKIPFNYDKKHWWRETCNDFRIYRLLRSHFLKKKAWKNAIFRIYRPLPYSSRDGENMLSSCPSARRNNPKNPCENCVA